MRALVTMGAAAVLAAAAVAPVHTGATRRITDMAGRVVTLPDSVRRVATLNSVPVINSLMMGLGQAGLVVNGVPDYAATPRYKYARKFAPGIYAQPNVLGSGREPNLEALLSRRPDVAFTLDRPTVEQLDRAGIPVVFLEWRKAEDVRAVMRLMGQVVGAGAAADDYVRYFDDVVARVTRGVAAVPRARRPRVLYCNLQRLSQDQLIGEWWMETAGGISVTNNGRTTEAFTFTLEQLFAWDPDVLIVANPDDRKALDADRRFAALKAMKTGRVLVAPVGAHIWTNRTVEQPLTLLWAAKAFLPAAFAGLDLEKEVADFYRRFFKVSLSPAEVREILSGA